MVMLTDEMWNAFGPEFRRRITNITLPVVDTTAVEPGQRALPESQDETPEGTEP
jgi:hypothetical protein